MLHLGTLVWYHCSMRIQVLTVSKLSQHKTWSITTTTGGCTSVYLNISTNKQQFSADVSDKPFPTFNNALRYYSSQKYSCFSASWSFLALGEDLKWKICYTDREKDVKKTVQLLHLFYTPKIFTLGLSQHQKNSVLVILCQFHWEFSKANGERNSVKFQKLWVNKKFSI